MSYLNSYCLTYKFTRQFISLNNYILLRWQCNTIRAQVKLAKKQKLCFWWELKAVVCSVLYIYILLISDFAYSFVFCCYDYRWSVIICKLKLNRKEFGDTYDKLIRLHTKQVIKYFIILINNTFFQFPKM